MRVLLDECLPRRLAALLVGHSVSTVPEAGWAGLKNGQLLAAIEGHCEVFVTIDRNLPVQQNIAARTFAVILIRAPSNRLADLVSLVPQLVQAIDAAKPGTVTTVAAIAG